MRARTASILVLASVVCALVCALAPRDANASERVVTRPGEAALPLIPDAADLVLTPDERARIDKGEIVVKLVERTKEDRQARAIGYLKHNPVELWSVAGDGRLQTEMYPEIEKFEELERWDNGKRFRATADVSMLLPDFHYTMTGCWNASKTALCWAQLEGDFDRNEGSQSFLWDPARHQTLAVFTFDLAMKGILSLVPESFILSLAGRNLPNAMHSVEAMVDKVRARDAARASSWDRDWAALEPRLVAGEWPGRLWSPGVPAATAASNTAHPEEPSP
jgi:hypothetical protein